MKCDYKDCEKEAVSKGFVSLRQPDSITGSKFMDVNACEIHKEENGFFNYVEEADKAIKEMKAGLKAINEMYEPETIKGGATK